VLPQEIRAFPVAAVEAAPPPPPPPLEVTGLDFSEQVQSEAGVKQSWDP